ncbi:MAG TPA: DNA-formamidopyrimidine glycosylase [Chloroflexota bacterium]|nr:DNA-formamidopyrimidine glycosylase [Chloroflexota bacterium]
MPELPEVETTARGLRERIVGRRIVTVGSLDWPRMAPNATLETLAKTAVGRTIESIARRGKYVIVGLSGDAYLVLHRKMSGNLVLRTTDLPAAPHNHLSVTFDDGWRLDFVDPRKFGRIYLFRGRDALDAFLDERLGPEPLEIQRGELDTLLERRRGRLKSLLLDQTFLAGIGNLYADEILWEACLHPQRSVESLTTRERTRLHEAIQQILTTAIERRGTSLSDYVDAEGEPGTNQEFLQVYGRAGLPCTREKCGRPIVRLVVAQRGTWLCPSCQPIAARRRLVRGTH